MKKIAELSSLSASVAVQASAILKPGDAAIAPVAVPSVTPRVSHESNSAAAIAAKNAGGTPPMSAPNGAGAWNAGGNVMTASLVPAIAYTLV